MIWLSEDKAFFVLQPALRTRLEVRETSGDMIAQNESSEHLIPTEIM